LRRADSSVDPCHVPGPAAAGGGVGRCRARAAGASLPAHLSTVRGSTCRRPPVSEGLGAEPAPLTDIVDARVLAWLGDSVTTDHISPAGSIPQTSPAGEWLVGAGGEPREVKFYGVRWGRD